MERIIMLDTEFVGIGKAFVYDIGYTVLQKIDNQYTPIKSENGITKQIFDNLMLFKTSYYEKKRNIYVSLLKGKKAKRRYWGHIMQTLQQDIDKYEVEAVFAYNASADEKAIAFTCDFVGVANPLDTVKVLDLMPLVQKHICDTKEYKEFSIANSFVNDSGYLKTSVESVCKFLYDDVDFEEQHTALDDVRHEINLLNAVVAMGVELKNITKRFIHTGITKQMTIEVREGGEIKEHTFNYLTKQNQKSKNRIVLTK